MLCPDPLYDGKTRRGKNKRGRGRYTLLSFCNLHQQPFAFEVEKQLRGPTKCVHDPVTDNSNASSKATSALRFPKQPYTTLVAVSTSVVLSSTLYCATLLLLVSCIRFLVAFSSALLWRYIFLFISIIKYLLFFFNYGTA